MTTIDVSIIIATFGGDHWAELGMGPARASALEQTHPAREVLNIHDHSLKMARNRGAWEAKGEVLIFLDADDELDPCYVQAIGEAYDNYPDVPRLLYPSVAYDDDPPIELPRPSNHPLPLQQIRGGNWMVIGTAITRDLFWQCEGFKDERAWEDWSLWMRAVGLGATPVHIPGAIYRARRSAEGRNSRIQHPRMLFDDILRANNQWLHDRGKP